MIVRYFQHALINAYVNLDIFMSDIFTHFHISLTIDTQKKTNMNMQLYKQKLQIQCSKVMLRKY